MLKRDGYTITYIEPDREGIVQPHRVADALRDDTALCSIMHVNNETGVYNDIAAIGAVTRARGVPLHVDAAQSIGKLPIDLAQLPVDLMSFTAHKIYGPKGAGVLYVRGATGGDNRKRMAPILFGGGQENGARPGTLATHQIVGLGAACELARERFERDIAHVSKLRDSLWTGLASLPGVMLNGHPRQRVCGILNVSFDGVEGESLLLAVAGLAVSAGSACNSAQREPSYVLRALGRDATLAQSSLRFSLGRFSTADEVAAAIRIVSDALASLRSISPLIA